MAERNETAGKTQHPPAVNKGDTFHNEWQNYEQERNLQRSVNCTGSGRKFARKESALAATDIGRKPTRKAESLPAGTG